MKKLTMVLATASLFVNAAAFAAAPAAPAAPATGLVTSQPNLMIAVIDLPKVLQHSPQMKAAADTLKAQYEPRQKKLIERQQALAKDQEKAKRDATVMSQADLHALQNKIASQERELQRTQEDYVQEVQAAQQKAMDGVIQHIDKVVQGIAQQGHYDLILQRNSIAFASPRVDITQQVIAKLNTK